MDINVKYATPDHHIWLADNDTDVSPEIIKEKIATQQILVAEVNSEPVGWLRFGYFWDTIPLMYMLAIEEPFRDKNIGTQLVQFWEHEMKVKKFQLVMTTTQSNETAQDFYRKLGYTDAGSFTLPPEPVELIFYKLLSD